jgi:hypothetical protein
MNTPDWREQLNGYIESMESAEKTDKKKFYNHDGGSDKARSALAALDSAAIRLQKFVRA